MDVVVSVVAQGTSLCVRVCVVAAVVGLLPMVMLVALSRLSSCRVVHRWVRH